MQWRYILSVPLNHKKGRTQGTKHPLPGVSITSCNCHISQETLIWGWNHLWCKLSQTEINFTELDIPFQSPVPLTRRYSEDDVLSAHLFASLEDGKTGEFLHCFMSGSLHCGTYTFQYASTARRDNSSSNAWPYPGERFSFRAKKAAPSDQLLTNNVLAHAAATTLPLLYSTKTLLFWISRAQTSWNREHKLIKRVWWFHVSQISCTKYVTFD